MGKIVMKKKKKKGRPSKSDLSRCRSHQSAGIRRTSRSENRSESDLRRSIRRRNLKYTDDLYEDDDEEEDDDVVVEEEEEDEFDEDERRKEKKKMKLVLRLTHGGGGAVRGGGGVDSVANRSPSGGGGGGRGSRRDDQDERVGHHHHHHQHHQSGGAAASVSASSSDEYGDDNKPFKKRRINGGGAAGGGGDDVNGVNGGDADDDDDDDEVGSIGSEDQKKEPEENGDSKVTESVPETPSKCLSGVPLPDKKQLELILDKLQKKDTYGVYLEPVDPEELPDYHDVIEHPMDFGTIRKKLHNGAYSTLDQLEADVLLLCSNAMQYNAPDTIYFKQARTIQELAMKKFQRLRNGFKRVEAELKCEQETKSSFVVKKPIKKSAWRTVQEPKSSCRTVQDAKPSSRTVQDAIGSDFLSGATLATNTEVCNGSNMTQAGGCEKYSNDEGLLDGTSSLADNKPEKAEEQYSGKGFPSKYGKKPFVLDENRRATYDISSQDMVKNESTFTLFEGENKQLVGVGLHADHSYARSLARFAATLGPVAWKVASQRIEEALPTGYRFGRGWVGEYEPLPTAVLMLEKQPKKQMFTNLRSVPKPRKDDQRTEELKATQDGVRLGLYNINSIGVTGTSNLQEPKNESLSGPMYRSNPGSVGISRPKPMVSAMPQQQNPLVTSSLRSDNNVLKQVEPNGSSLSSMDPMNIASRELPVQNSNMSTSRQSSEMATARMMEMVSRNRNLVQSMPFKLPDADGLHAAGLPNGKTVSSTSNNHRPRGFSSDFIPNQQARPAIYGHQQQGLSDPVQMLRMLAEKTQNTETPSNRPTADSPQLLSAPSLKRDDSSAAGTGVARAWMTLGVAQSRSMDSATSPKFQIAPSLHNPSVEIQSASQVREEPTLPAGLQWQPGKKTFPPQAFLQQSVRVGDEPQFQNNRPVLFPQLVRTDLSRFQVQSPWRGLNPHTQPNKRQDARPPDLNIGFQSSGSPGKQSSGIPLDSQQPDLALQL